MIEESIKEFLIKKHGELNFQCLVSILENSNIPFHNKRLRGPAGLTSFKCIYVDIDILKSRNYNDMEIYFVFLHEMCHFKRINKYGTKFYLDMLSEEDFDKFSEDVVNEEIVYDRYASFLFTVLNKKTYPKHMTQRLDDPDYKSQYKSQSRQLFGYVKNDEEKYNKLIKSFIV